MPGMRSSDKAVHFDTAFYVILYRSCFVRRLGRDAGAAHHRLGFFSGYFCVLGAICTARSTGSVHIVMDASLTARTGNRITVTR